MTLPLVRLLQALAVTGAAALLILRFIALDAASHSASDTLRPWLIESVLIAGLAVLVVVALGRLASRRPTR